VSAKEQRKIDRVRGRTLQRRRRYFFAQHPLCVRCEAEGRVTEAVELDHKDPLFKGGKDDVSNVQGLCRSCYLAKTAEDFGHRKLKKIGLDGFPVENEL